MAKSPVKKEVFIRPAEEEDFKRLPKKRYFFNWKQWKGKPDVYKLSTADDDILGIMALEDCPYENRIEIKLLASSKENVGSGKQFEGIVGNMVAYAGRLAVTRYGDKACVSLLPKTKLKPHYMETYGMLDGGRQVYLEGKPLIEIILKYQS